MTNYLLAFAGITMLAAIAGTIMSVHWSPWYFRHGLPLYRRRLSFHLGDSLESLEYQLSFTMQGRLGPSMVFKSISQCELAFREKYWEPHIVTAPDIMHGLIRYLPESQEVVVTGYLNWSWLVFVGFMALFHTPLIIAFIVYLVIFLGLAMGYGMQYSRYDLIVDAVSGKEVKGA